MRRSASPPYAYPARDRTIAGAAALSLVLIAGHCPPTRGAATARRERAFAPQITMVRNLRPTFVPLDSETVVASAVVTDAPYDADPNGRRDATTAIQRALNDVARVNGGVVFLPAGRYRLDGSLTVGYGTCLRGEWHPPERRGIGKGTILLAYAGRGEEDASPLITLPSHRETSLSHVTIWYPEQDPTAPVPYPPTVGGGSAQVRNVTLCNSYDGIALDLFNGCVVSDVYGTVLNRGIVAPESFEFSWMYRVRFSPDYWMQALTALAGLDASDTVREKVADSMRSRLVGLELGRVDALAIYDFAADPAKVPVLIRKNDRVSQHRVHGFGGVVAKFPRRREEHGWDPWYYGMHFANVDNVPEAEGKHYRFATMPRPARTEPASFIDVTEPPYSAAGDGSSDDTPAVSRALRDAGDRGGGTVYLRQGEYRITAPLVVPRGVELRGPFGAGRLRQIRETCSLAADFGHGSDSPERDAALITLLDNAGVRGLTVVHPRQAYDVGKLLRYPYSIRGRGRGVWIVDVHLLNSCYGIDLATHRCDEHLVTGVWGTAFYRGLDVGGGSRDGKLERVAFSYGPWAEAGRAAHARNDHAVQAMAEFCKRNNVHYSFGTCTGQTAWGLVGFHPRIHLHFYNDGGEGCRGAEIWQSMLDVADVANVKVDAGERISLVGFFGTGGRDQKHNWIEVARDAAGPVDVYAKTVEQKFLNHPHRFGPETVRVFDEASLTAGRPAHGPGTLPGRSAAFAVDREPRTVWEAPEGGKLCVDLGAEKVVDRVGVETARLFSDQTSPNLAIEVRASRDGRTFHPVTTLRPGPWGWVDVPVARITARYLQLTVAGSDGGIARVASFDAWGPGE